MLRVIKLTGSLIILSLAVAIAFSAPIPRPGGDTSEMYIWKEKKYTRTIKTLIVGDTEFNFVKIPSGSFRVEGQGGQDSHESHRKVTFTKSFWVTKYPVTNKQFGTFVTQSKYKTESETSGVGGWGFNGKSFVQGKGLGYDWQNTGWEQSPQHPVVNVTWNDAVTFTKWISKESKLNIRLLGEAEYEYAARGDTTSTYISGDDARNLKAYSNIADQSARNGWRCRWSLDIDDGEAFSSPVGKYLPNIFGLYDMDGNVYSWCEDWYHAVAYRGTKGDIVNPRPNVTTPATCRVCRGGSWRLPVELCQATYRYQLEPTSAEIHVGFRVAFSGE